MKVVKYPVILLFTLISLLSISLPILSQGQLECSPKIKSVKLDGNQSRLMLDYPLERVLVVLPSSFEKLVRERGMVEIYSERPESSSAFSFLVFTKEIADDVSSELKTSFEKDLSRGLIIKKIESASLFIIMAHFGQSIEEAKTYFDSLSVKPIQKLR